MAARAVIYLPPDVDRAKWLPRCLVHCNRRDYHVIGIVQSPAGWQSVHEMMAGGEADVVVVGRFGQLPPDRMPRIEEATDAGQPPTGRRPRTIR
jgi:hypothetical protein